MLEETAFKAKVAKAIRFLGATREPHALLFMNIIHRRFGVDEFADTLERFDRELDKHPARAPVLRVLRRIADASNPIVPADWEQVTNRSDRLLVSALYCDRLGLPASFAEALDRDVAEGGYALTHALLAWTWVQDNRCALAVPDGFLERLFGGAAAIVDKDPTTIDDLKLEAAAFLCLARQSRRVDPAFVQRVVAIQNADGGWGQTDAAAAENRDESSWHSTVLALILLLHVDFR